MTRERLARAIREADGFPSFPEVVLSFDAEMRKPEPSLQVLAAIVEQDPPLAAGVLRVANSAAQGASREMTSIRAAVVRLGLRELRRLVLTTAIYRRFSSYGGTNPKQFWLHSVLTAMLTRAIVRRSTCGFGEDAIEMAFTAGLLHDIGVLVLAYLVPDEYAELAALVRSEGGLLNERELERWSIDHGEAGELLAISWQLPMPIAQVVRYHHAPWAADPAHRTLVQVVHLANFVSNNQGFGRSEEGFPESFDHGAWQALGLTLEAIPALIDEVREEGSRSENLLELAT